jgi:tetratricopeptide (TPR) repeat protein
MRQAGDFLEQQKWEEAKKPLEESLRYYPEQTGSGNAYELLAYAHRQLGQTNDERRVLSQWAARENDAIEAFHRLMVLGEAAGDWPDVLQNARRYLAASRSAPNRTSSQGRPANKWEDRRCHRVLSRSAPAGHAKPTRTGWPFALQRKDPEHAKVRP